jgi:hypothetical protein
VNHELDVRPIVREQPLDGYAVPDIRSVVDVPRPEGLLQSPPAPRRRGRRHEEAGPKIVVDADHVEALPGKEARRL